MPSSNLSFDLDLDAIDAAITPRTRLVIVNTPHNPTGRIYGSETLVACDHGGYEAFRPLAMRHPRGRELDGGCPGSKD
jgi:hypothetical protein